MRPAATEDAEFERLVRNAEELDLSRIALEIASDFYPQLDIAPYREKIRELAARVARRVEGSGAPRAWLEAINSVLFDQEGFRGNHDDYYDPRNSYLNEVLDRRMGIPISLSVLYLAVAREAGVFLDGVNLPGHFVVRTRLDPPLFVDAFHGGEILDSHGCEEIVSRLAGKRVTLEAGHLTAATPRAMVSRILRNLKAIHWSREEYECVLPVLRRLARLHPGDAIEQRDLGIASLHTHRPRLALRSLQSYLAAKPGAPDAAVVGALIAEAHRRIQAMH